MKFTWKIAFIILAIVFILSSSYFIFKNLDKNVTIEYMSDGYEKTKIDVDILSGIISKTNQSRTEIEEYLKENHDFEEWQFEDSLIQLNGVSLRFENGELSEAFQSSLHFGLKR